MLAPPSFKEGRDYAFFMRDYKGEAIKLLPFYMTDFLKCRETFELGILLKCRETFEKCLAACNSSKNAGLPQFFSKVSDNCILRTSTS